MSNRKPDLKAVTETKRFIVPNEGDRYVTRAIDCFLNTDDTKQRFGPYFVDGDQLVFRTVATSRTGSELLENIVAQKIDQGGSKFLVGNSSALGEIGRRVHYGQEERNTAVTEIQMRLGNLIPMMPFSVFEEADLNMEALRIVQRGPEEEITRLRDTGKRAKKGAKLQKGERLRGESDYDKKYHVWILETVHYTGASLFKVGSKHFLFDLDRRELEQQVFNPFLVQLFGPAETIAEAYEAMKPVQVREAEKSGTELKRQGEWFFIKAPKDVQKRCNEIETLANVSLRAGDNRPNECKAVGFDKDGKVVEVVKNTHGRLGFHESPDDDDLKMPHTMYVTGRVRHTGREHADLMLKGFWIAVPNTATDSWQISGDID